MKSYADKRLERAIRHNDWPRIPPNLRSRVRSLIALEDASTLQTLALPHYRLHPLTGDRAGFYALRMDSLQRIVFRFEDGNVHNVEPVDYHG